MALQGLYQGLSQGLDQQQRKHQQLVENAIQQAQVKHQQQELDLQRDNAESEKQNRLGLELNRLDLRGQEMYKQGATGSDIADTIEPAIKMLGLGDHQPAKDYIDNWRKKPQNPAFVAAQKKLQDTEDQKKADAAAKSAQFKATFVQKAKQSYIAQKWPADQANAQALMDYYDSVKTTEPQDKAGSTMAAGGAMVGQGQPQAQPMQPPADHGQLAQDAIAQASGKAPQTVPGQQQPPSPGGPVAPPASGQPPGAGVPQSMINPTQQITGQQPPPQQAAPPPQQAQPIYVPPAEGISGVSPKLLTDQVRDDILNKSRQAETEYKQEQLRQLREKWPEAKAQALLKTQTEQADLTLKKQQAQKNALLMPWVTQELADKHLTAVTNAQTKVFNDQFKVTQENYKRAEAAGDVPSLKTVISLRENARKLIDMKNSIQTERSQIQQGIDKAKYVADPTKTPIPDQNDPNYKNVIAAKEHAKQILSTVIDPKTHRPGPTTYEARLSELHNNLLSIQEMEKSNQEMLQKARGIQGTDNGGKPNQPANPFQGGKPYDGNGKDHLKFPDKNAGQIVPGSAAAKLIKNRSTKDLLKRLAEIAK